MACRQCQERRQIIAQAAQQGGTVGVVKVIPTITSHIVNDVRDRMTFRKPRK